MSPLVPFGLLFADDSEEPRRDGWAGSASIPLGKRRIERARRRITERTDATDF